MVRFQQRPNMKEFEII